MSENDLNGSYYEILGVNISSSPGDIKKAFKLKASQYHPDKKPHGDTEKFQIINRAYTVLSDEKLRKEYNQNGYKDRADNPFSQVDELITKLILKAMESHGFKRRNYLEIVSQNLKALCSEAEVHIRKCEKEISDYEYFKKHLEVNSCLDRVLSDKCKQATEQVDLAKDSIELFKTAIKLVDKMEYTGEDIREYSYYP